LKELSSQNTPIHEPNPRCRVSFEEYRGSFDARTILPFRKHQKPKKKDDDYELDGLVLDWPRLWRTKRASDACKVLRRMDSDSDSDFKQFYVNSIAFVEESAERHNWWERAKSVDAV
jgi:hypothetical protein